MSIARCVKLFLFASFVACGGAAPPTEAPKTAPSVEAPSSAASPAPPETPTPAGATPAAASAEGRPPAPTPDGTPKSPNDAPAAGVIAEGHDECAGVAAPFEEKVRAKFNECYQAGKKKNPELAGTIKVTLKIDVKGKIKYVSEPSKLDKPAFDCMVKAVRKEPFDSKACKGKDVAVSKTFGAR